MNIVELFVQAADRYPDHIAICAGKQKISYAALRKEVEETAAYYQHAGIQKGDRVLVFIPMSIALYRTVMSLFYIGAVAVFLDDWVSWKRMEMCCKIAECRGFIGIPKARILSVFSKPLRAIPITLSMHGTDKRISVPEQMEAVDPALITFTTGSTGIPKAALRTHGFLQAQFAALMQEIKPTPFDVDMPVLPIVLFMHLGVGSTSVIAQFNQKKARNAPMHAQAAMLSAYQIDRITASPYFLYRLATHCIRENITTDTVQKIFTGGAAVFPSSAQLLLRAFPKADIQIVYGSTEAEPISAISAEELVKSDVEQKGGLPVGKINEGITLRIIPISNQQIHNSENELHSMFLPDGMIGEIIVSGPHVLAAYYKNEAAFSRNKIRDGNTIWHRTGDSGFTQNGELFLTGPCAQLIRRNNAFISPFIVEYMLHSIPEISSGTVLEKNGKIILVLESKNKNAAAYIPAGIIYDAVHIVKHIPRDPRHFSKIDHEKLSRMI